MWDRLRRRESEPKQWIPAWAWHPQPLLYVKEWRDWRVVDGKLEPNHDAGELWSAYESRHNVVMYRSHERYWTPEYLSDEASLAAYLSRAFEVRA